MRIGSTALVALAIVAGPLLARSPVGGVGVAGVAGVGSAAGGTGVPAEHRMERVGAVTTIAPGLEHSQYDDGTNQADVLEADLTEPGLGVSYVYNGTVAKATALSEQATRSGVVAAVNGSFFDRGDTNAPRGNDIDHGHYLEGSVQNWNDTVAFSKAPGSDGGTIGRLATMKLDATVTLPTGAVLEPTNLNSWTVATGGIGIFNADWGSVPRSQTVDGASGLREVQLHGGVVTAVRTTPGQDPVPAGDLVLLGREAGATSLAGLAIGDKVEVTYRPSHAGDPIDTAVTGNPVLVRDGTIDVPDDPRNPRTAVGFSADGRRMWLVALDGRSDSSQGMTFVELATFMKSLGADDALNLDGGGSTTMVAKAPGEAELAVQNVPSDGSERLLPNGLGFTSSAYPPVCVEAELDFSAYGDLAEGSSGPQVLEAECLLKNGSGFPGVPDQAYDEATSQAVKAFQSARGLPTTGRIGAHEWTAILASGATPTLRSGAKGLAVKRLQRSLTAALGSAQPIDGTYGSATASAVEAYQSDRGLPATGTVDAATWQALQAGR